MRPTTSEEFNMIHIDTLSKTFRGGKGLTGSACTSSPAKWSRSSARPVPENRLMRHIAGLMPGDADGGRIEVAQHLIQDRGVISRDIRTMRAEIGMVFQQFQPLPTYDGAREPHRAPIQVKGMKKAEILPYAKELLEKVGLADARTTIRRSSRVASSSVWPSRAPSA